MYESGHICNAHGLSLFTQAIRPANFFARARGLIRRAPLKPSQAWWFERCNAVHTCGVRSPIDVLHLSDEGDLLLIDPALPPWRVSVCRGGAHVVELGAGRAEELDLQIGTQLRFCR